MTPRSPSADLPPVSRAGILVVDDEPIVLHLLATVLPAEGIPIWMAAGGPEALSVYERHRERVAGVLLDVRMPGMDGPQLLAELRRLDPDLPCCFMTGHSAGYTMEDLVSRGGLYVFDKPFRWDDMVAALRKLLDDHVARSRSRA